MGEMCMCLALVTAVMPMGLINLGLDVRVTLKQHIALLMCEKSAFGRVLRPVLDVRHGLFMNGYRLSDNS